MNGFASVLALYLVVVALVSLLVALGAPLRTSAVTGVVVAEVLLVVGAALDLARMASGQRPAEPAVHLGYVLVSVAMIPLLMAQRLPERPRFAVLSLTCLLTVVVVVRQAATA